MFKTLNFDSIFKNNSLGINLLKNKILIENKEAIFFKNANECIQKCKKILNNEKLLKKISLNGHLQVTKKLKLSVDEMVKKIVFFSIK